MPERLCHTCGGANEPRREVLDGVEVVTFPTECAKCRAREHKGPVYNPKKRRSKAQIRRYRLRHGPGGPYEPTRYIGRVETYDSMCYYCELQPADTLDHVIPVSRGGGNWPSNIVPCCRECGTTKGAKVFRYEWLPRRFRNTLMPATRGRCED